MNVKSLSSMLRKHKDTLKEYGVEALFVFGSVKSGKNNKRSDLDILVDFNREVGLFDFVALKEYLEKVLKVRVDLVTRDALKDWMADSIESDTVRVA